MGIGYKKISYHIIDSFIILIHITYGISMLQVWFLDPLQIPFRFDLIGLTLLAFLYRFGWNFKLLSVSKKPAFVVFFLTYIADIVQNIFTTSAGSAVVRVFTMLDMFLFMEYIYAVYLEARRNSTDSIAAVTKPYEFFTVYNVLTILICAELILIGILNPYSNPLSPNSLTMSHYVNQGQIHYFPGFLSLTGGYMRGLLSYNVPVLTGLTHEPNALFLLIGPVFFLLLRRFQGKALLIVALYVSFFLLLLIATSTTAIVVFAIVVIIEQFYEVFYGNKRKLSNIIVLILIAVIGVLVMRSDLVVALLDTADMIESKTSVGADEGSLGHAMTMLNYIITPHSFFGHGNMPVVAGEGWGYSLKNQDIGLMSCVLDILFFVIMFYKSIVNAFSKDHTSHFWGMASLYFMLHMLKLSVQEFGYPQLAFFVVMSVIIDQERLRSK